MDYSKLIKDLTADMKKGVQYKRIPSPYNILTIIAMIPLIVTFVLSKFAYWVTLFFYKMISAPAEYLHQWLKTQKDEVKHATQAVTYFVCLPFIFFLQVLLSISAISFFIQWFFLMLQGYLLTLGGIKWQPFITEASFEDEGTEYELKPQLTAVSVFACVSGVAFILYVLISIVSLFFDPFESADLLEALSTTNNIISLIYSIMIFIVNPLLFKRTPKN